MGSSLWGTRWTTHNTQPYLNACLEISDPKDLVAYVLLCVVWANKAFVWLLLIFMLIPYEKYGSF